MTILAKVLMATVLCAQIVSPQARDFTESEMREMRLGNSMIAKEEAWPLLKQARASFTALHPPPLNPPQPDEVTSIMFIGRS